MRICQEEYVLWNAVSVRLLQFYSTVDEIPRLKCFGSQP